MSTPRRKRNPLPAIAQAGPVSLWMILFVTLPMLFIIYISFMTRGTFGGVEYTPTLEAYKTMMDATYFAVILKSLQVAVVTTLVCLLLGYPAAYFLASKDFNRNQTLFVLILLPMWMNFLLRTYAMMTFIYTDGLVLLGLITNFLPFAVLPMYSSIEKLQTAMLEASADLGAKPSVTFRKVTLPLTFPGIFSAIILTFIPALGTYTITDMLGGGKVLYIGNIIKNQFGTIRNWPLGAALSVLLLVITALLIFLYSRFARIEDMEVL